MSKVFEEPRIRIVGERGLLVEYGDAIAPEINQKVRAMSMALAQFPSQGIMEVIPTYRSLLIVYDPLQTDAEEIKYHLEKLELTLNKIEIPDPKTIEIPVCYGGEFGPDLEFVAGHAGLTVDEVVRLHAAPTYQIYMMGFTPGFPFLGGLHKALITPRLQTPRTLVPAGSVGIANDQTGIYPIDSPGGWRIIGHTPLKLFSPHRKDPFLFKSGDLLRFIPISRDEYERLRTE